MKELSMDLVGGEQLVRELERLKLLQSEPTIKSAFKDAAAYVVQKGKNKLRERINFRTSTGGLARSMTSKTDKRGSLAGFNLKRGSHGRLSWLIDRGTKDRVTARGRRTGHITPNYFWTETRDKDVPVAMEMVRSAIAQAIKRMTTK